MKNQLPFEILTVGSPCVDRLIHVPHEFIDRLPGQKGGAMAVDHHMLLRLLKESGAKETLVAGGSASNTTKGLANFGYSCGLTGTLCNDDMGTFFLQSLQGLPITPLYHTVNTPTAEVLCMITPDGDRTQRPHLGASTAMSAAHLDETHFEGCKLVLLEGFALRNEGLLEGAMTLSKQKGCSIALGLSSFEIAAYHRKQLHNLLPKYVDLVFASHDEASTLTGLAPDQAAIALSKLCEVAVVTGAEKGCWVAQNGSVVHCPTVPVTPLDVTGAGDIFMAGFLHGWLQKLPVTKCAEIGCRLGAAVTQVMGPCLPRSVWETILKEIGSKKN
jgi:sugar/nucleoside kinase (ribokinase family)